MRIAVYPGSFDPVTLGHLDIIERSSKMVDKLIVGVLNNSAKNPLFSVAERVTMLKNVTAHLSNVEVTSFDGLLVDFAVQCHAQTVVRGLRAITDFEYELQMSQTNRIMCPELDTMFLHDRLKICVFKFQYGTGGCPISRKYLGVCAAVCIAKSTGKI